jgi:uncharacterized membrane protein HdeD (DUF308 family)
MKLHIIGDVPIYEDDENRVPLPDGPPPLWIVVILMGVLALIPGIIALFE